MTDTLDTKTHVQLKILCNELKLSKHGSSQALKERIRIASCATVAPLTEKALQEAKETLKKESAATIVPKEAIESVVNPAPIKTNEINKLEGNTAIQPAPPEPIKSTTKELKLIIDTDEITRQAVELDPEIRAQIQKGQRLRKKDELIPQIQSIFGGRASVEYVDTGDTCQGFSFTGGPRKAYYVTLHQPEQLILRHARQFVSRTEQGDIGKIGYEQTNQRG